MKKTITAILSSVTLILLVVTPALAHVVVKPKEAGIAAYQTFTVGVPNESDDHATTAVRLVIPDGLGHVSPNVKPGWNIEIKKETSEEAEEKITEIIWTEGSIPVGQRDEFLFSAKTPENETTLPWKAYQTYADGEIVAWDQDPKTVEEYTKSNPPKEDQHDHNAPKPFSVTKIINDLNASPANESDTANTASASITKLASKINLLMLLSGGALILSLAAIYMQMTKKK